MRISIFGEPAATEEDAVLAALWYATRAADPGALWSDTTGWRLGRRRHERAGASAMSR